LFLRQCSQISNESHAISPLAERALLDYSWPGNLRELKHSLERACIMSHQPVLDPPAFFDEASSVPPQPHNDEPSTDGSLSNYLRDCERQFILHALQRNKWHFGNTAASLDITRKNLWEKMKKLDIHAEKDMNIPNE
jgi:DNA-binding NtrC family response regulator